MHVFGSQSTGREPTQTQGNLHPESMRRSRFHLINHLAFAMLKLVFPVAAPHSTVSNVLPIYHDQVFFGNMYAHQIRHLSLHVFMC